MDDDSYGGTISHNVPSNAKEGIRRSRRDGELDDAELAIEKLSRLKNRELLRHDWMESWK
jgi:hypothetical protein